MTRVVSDAFTETLIANVAHRFIHINDNGGN